MKSHASDHFNELLASFSTVDEMSDRKRIEQQIWDEYGSINAVFVLDMSGFSLLAQKYGVVHYLSMVYRMQITSKPIIESYNGEIIKFEADNCFAVFPTPAEAIYAAKDLNHAFDAENILTPDELDIKIAIGIDYGKTLIIDNSDFFGNVVNRASKLGEDVADPGEILVTREAMLEVPENAGINSDELSLSISGIDIDVHKIKY